MLAVISSLPIALFAAALLLGFLGVSVPFADQGLSTVAQWLLVLSLGVSSLWAALGHLAFSERVARSIGWETSPFQLEIGWANLGLGFGAIAAAALGKPAAWTVLIVGGTFLWGAAIGHAADMIKRGNFAINNAGPIFWWDILLPVVLAWSLS